MGRLVLGSAAMAVALGACTGSDDGDGGNAATSGSSGSSGAPATAGDDGDDGGPPSTTSDPDPDTGSAASSGDPDPSDSTADSTGGTTSAADTGTSGGNGLCGNGMLDEGEGCDDPNGEDADGCNEDCTVSGAILWSHTQASGFNLSDDNFGITVDDDGNAYVAGAFNNDETGSDLWVRQYTADGGLGWTVSVNGSAGASDAARDIVRVGDAVYVGGFLNASGASNNWHLGEYSLGGAAGWTASFSGAALGSDVIESVAADGAGNVFAAGRQAVSMQGNNVMVRQYLPGGAAGWTMSYGGAALGDDRALGVATDPTGNVIVVGYETVTGQARDGWMRKYDPAGVELWTRGYQGVDALDDHATGVATDATGNVFVAGFEGTTLQGAIGWLRRYDPEGLEAWTQPWPGVTDEGASFLDVVVDEASHVVVGGTETVAGTAEALVRKYDAGGNALWSETYATDVVAGQSVRAVTTGPGNRIWIAGSLNLGIDARDAWVAQIAQ